MSRLKSGRGNDHGDAAGDAALDSGREAEGFDGQQLAMLWRRSADFACVVRGLEIASLVWLNRDRSVMLVRQHFEEPSHGGAHASNDAEQADHPVRDHARDDAA